MDRTKPTAALLLGLLASLALAACTEPGPAKPIEISISSSSGDLVFLTQNNTSEDLKFSGHLYGNAPSPQGDFYISVMDDHGQPVGPCQVIHRPDGADAKVLRAHSSIEIREEMDGLYRGYCLDRSRTYRAALRYWLVTGPESDPKYLSNWAPFHWP